MENDLSAKYLNLKIRCKCQNPMKYKDGSYKCEICNNEYEIKNGVCMVSGNHANNGRMNVKSYHQLVKVSESHFWFKYRNQMINKIINSNFKNTSKLQILDVGCGDANVVRYLSNKGFNVTGCDINVEGLFLSNLKVPLFHADISTGLFSENQFDVILLLDVIEHVSNDKQLLKTAKKLLTKNGLLIVMVPAGKYLWSSFDDVAGHYRRYSINLLKQSLLNCDYKIMRITYFMTLLLPIYLLRTAKYRSNEVLNDQITNENLFINNKINRVLAKICDFESILLNYLNLRFGASLLAISKK